METPALLRPSEITRRDAPEGQRAPHEDSGTLNSAGTSRLRSRGQLCIAVARLTGFGEQVSQVQSHRVARGTDGVWRLFFPSNTAV